MVGQGLTTFAEWEVEPRSDCHAWSASPNYYFLSLVTGILPTAPGFKTVQIKPALGPLTQVNSQMPHPLGAISVHLERVGTAGVNGEITLPTGLTGEFVWNGKVQPLKAGLNQIQSR
jgi:hypothetical protein